MIIDTRNNDNVFVLHDVKTVPDSDGVLDKLEIRLPEIKNITYFSAYQRHDPMFRVEKKAVTGGTNRVQGLKIKDFTEANEGGLFIIAELSNGDWLALLPVAGRETLAWFAPENDKLFVKLGTLGTAETSGSFPVLSWCRAKNVYQACQTAWENALKHPLMDGMGKLREDKEYPEIFKYLGWCSWEQYRKDISADKLAHAVRSIKSSKVPVRFVLIDDGYLLNFGEKTEFRKACIKSFNPIEETFPQDFATVINERDAATVCWFGLWQCFNGYWGNIAEDNLFDAEFNSHLMIVPSHGKLPKASLQDARFFYDRMIGKAKDAGFDFVKIDDQAQNLMAYEGCENAVKASVYCSQAMEQAAGNLVNGLINCMAHGLVNVFNTSLSSVTRCSEDYLAHNAWRAKTHLHNSYQNMLWLAPTVWGDHDMFHSSDSFAGRIMAVSKAMSGGPIYLSDAPDEFSREFVEPLCWSDGKILRPKAPAVVLPQSISVDPFEDARPYYAAAPLSNSAVAIAAYNLTEPEVPVRGRITVDDYLNAGGFLDVEMAIPENGLVLYDWFKAAAFKLDSHVDFSLEKFDHYFVLLCPVIDGWAVIGATGKYLSPVGVKVIYRDTERLVLENLEAGEVTVWANGSLIKRQAPKGNIEFTK